MKMAESPMFSRLKEEGKTSVNPIKESFSHKANFKMVLMALFGAVMGQGVIWYTGQFYAQNFLETKCNIEFEQSRTIMLWAIAFATPFFLFWGWLSDKIGRKWIMMAGMLLGILTYRPIFSEFLRATDIPAQLSSAGILSTKTETIQHAVADHDSVIITSSRIKLKNNFSYTVRQTVPINLSIESSLKSADMLILNKHLPGSVYWKFIGLVFLLILYVTMVYGPIAAFLVEIFPTKIRYTSMSLPYHIGNGVFGGLVPFIGLLLTTSFPADPLVGLWYPIGVAALCFIIGSIYLTNKIDENVED
jgi:MFS family permease